MVGKLNEIINIVTVQSSLCGKHTVYYITFPSISAMLREEIKWLWGHGASEHLRNSRGHSTIMVEMSYAMQLCCCICIYNGHIYYNSNKNKNSNMGNYVTSYSIETEKHHSTLVLCKARPGHPLTTHDGYFNENIARGRENNIIVCTQHKCVMVARFKLQNTISAAYNRWNTVRWSTEKHQD